ncbi:MAG TPA: ATP-binding protein [Terriglobales bacterium]
MNLSSLLSHAFGGISVPRLTPQESGALIILAASLLVYRTFRERYLLVWILGWVAYLVSHWGIHSSAAGYPTLSQAIFQAAFLLAVCLFATSIFLYSHAQKYVLPLLLISLAAMGYAVAQAVWWPHSVGMRLGLEITYHLMTLAAALSLLRFRWGRGEVGPWLLALSLLCMQLDWSWLSRWIGLQLPVGFDLLADVMLGLSMLLVVFDDSLTRTRRLGVINALISSITRAQQHEPMMSTALEELKKLMNAKAAWFRVLDGEKLVITQQIGLSEDFLRDRASVPLDDKFENTLSGTNPVLVKTSTADDSVRPYLKKERFDHVVVVPVHGRKSAIGTLTLGSRGGLSYAPDEMEFLTTSAHQLGMVFENTRLVEQILRSHRQWANTFDSIQDVVLVHDADFRIMRANRALLGHLVRSAADVAGQTCEEVLPREHGNWRDCPYCAVSQEGFYEGPDQCFGGTAMVSTSSYVDQTTKQKGTIHVVRDITERTLAEEKYRLLFEQMQEGVFATTPDGKLLDCNEALVRMLGYASRSELMSLNVDTQLYGSAERREAFRREVEANNYVRNFEVVLRRKDGSLLAALESSFATRGPDGKIDRYQGFLLDITEKKRAEDEIRRRNRELNALNAMAVIATQSFDLDEILSLTLRQVLSLLTADSGSIYLSDIDETTFRRRADWGQRLVDRSKLSEVQFPGGFGDLVTRSRTEVITPEYLPHLPPLVAEFIRTDSHSSWIWVLLWGKDRPVGMMGIGSAESREYSTNDENLLVAVGRQLATTIEKVRLYEETCRAYEDLRQTQEQLLQSEKMSAVGQLIAGVAHELNNPLTAILGYAQLLQSEQLDEKVADYVEKLYKQAQRTHRVVQNLLSFARQRKPQKQSVDVRKALDETLMLRDYDLKINNIRVIPEIDHHIPAVTADPHQLEQVFLNVINNAVDAMLEKGEGGTLKVRMYTKDNHVHAEFHDTGPGIKEPGRIFDPFYTTKSVGKGTGLGLSICYGIIKEHGGDIAARNRQEGGAVLEIKLPASAQSTPAEKTSSKPRREVAVEGRILLIEDEEAILELERDVLTGAGAQVVALSSNQEVQARLLEESFDALIMNGKMTGGWNTEEAYQWLSEKCPGLEKRVLVTFSAEPAPELRSFMQEHNVPFLVKPFEVSEVITQVRRLLQKAHAAGAGQA